MEPKNVMLLGFVNRAVDYLEQHMDDEHDSKLAELKNINLNALKSELKDDLGSSLGAMNSTMDALIQAGEDSFDKFIDVPKKERINNEIDRMFNVDLDSDEPIDEKASLEELLNFYNLGDDMLLDDENLDHRFSRRITAPVSRKPVLMDEEQLERNFEQFVGHNPRNKRNLDVMEPQEDMRRYVFSDNSKRRGPDFDEYVYIRNDDNGPDFASKRNIVENPAIENKSNIILNNTIPAARKEEEEPIFMMSEEDSRLLDMIARNVEKTQESVEAVKKNTEENRVEEELDDVFSEVMNNDDEDGPSLDNIIDSETVENLIDYATDDDAVAPADKDDIMRLLQDMDVNNQKNPFDDLIDNGEDNVYTEEVSTPSNNYQSVQQQPGFVNSLIDDLREKMIQEDERRQAIEEEYAQVFDRIHKTYPYLSSGFVRSVYELKDSIASEYPFNVKIIVLHRVIFREVDYLRQFVEIALNHDFSINADEDKMIVDVFKEYINTDGKIITSIFDVSNQAALLGGEYDGYRVLFTQKV